MAVLKSILVVHGPSIGLLNALGGAPGAGENLERINEQIRAHAAACGFTCTFFRSNHEGEIVDALERARIEFDGVVLNAGGYAHYSYVIRDAAALLTIPCIEVHLSNIFAAGERISILAPVCTGFIAGFGKCGYFLAVSALHDLLLV